MGDAEEGAFWQAGPSTAPLSFSFIRTAARRRLAGLVDGLGAAPKEKGFFKIVEGRKLQSVNPSEAPKELVIPLIQNGPGRLPATQAPGPSAEATVDGVLSQVVKELIEESKKSLNEKENEGVDPILPTSMIQSRCILNEEGADRKPWAKTVPKEADYEAVPVEAGGLAILQGMGWKPGQGIGRTFSEVVKLRVNTPRPKGLGLGTHQSDLQALAPTSPLRLLRPDAEHGRDKEDQSRGLAPGGTVLVLSGPHRGLYGKVEGLHPDSVRAMVRLAVGNCMVTVNEDFLRTVSQQEFDKNSLDLSQVSKTSPGGTALSWETFQDQDLPTQRGAEERKRKHLPSQQEERTSKREKAASRRQHWLHRDLRVRFVDKPHKYYNTKMTIEDVFSPDTCMCQTDGGQVLEGVREDMLETLVPKVQGSRVMVVLGPQAGRVGHLLGWDREQSRAVVHLQRENQLVELHYDAVCEYMGPRDSDED